MLFIDERYRVVVTSELKVIQQFCIRETTVSCLPYSKLLTPRLLKKKRKENLGSMEMIPLSVKIFTSNRTSDPVVCLWS